MQIVVQNGADAQGKPLIGITITMTPDECGPFCDLIHQAARNGYTQMPVVESRPADEPTVASGDETNEPAYMKGDGQREN